MKKRGFGAGKYNEFGGKVLEGESIEFAAVREFKEETNGAEVLLEDLIKVAEVEFYFPESRKDWNQKVHFYISSNYSGTPNESEEMTTEWFSLDKIPYHKMWETDSHWLPVLLENIKFRGKIHFNDDCSTTKSFEYQEVEGF